MPAPTPHERHLYLATEDVLNANGAAAHYSTKLSDVTDPRHAGDDFNWATRAHIDLFVRDKRTLEPLFAIEVDGAHHETDPIQIHRDRLKDRLLERAGIDYMRVTNNHVATTHGKQLLTNYLINLWLQSQAFHAAQRQGHIPRDEIFLHFATFIPTGIGHPAEPLDPTMTIRARLWQDHTETGVPIHPIPHSWHRYQDRIGRIDTLTILPLTDTEFLSHQTRIGSFRISGVVPNDIGEEINLLAIADSYHEWKQGEPIAHASNELASVVPAPNQGWTTYGWGSTGGWIITQLGDHPTRHLTPNSPPQNSQPPPTS